MRCSRKSRWRATVSPRVKAAPRLEFLEGRSLPNNLLGLSFLSDLGGTPATFEDGASAVEPGRLSGASRHESSRVRVELSPALNETAGQFTPAPHPVGQVSESAAPTFNQTSANQTVGTDHPVDSDLLFSLLNTAAPRRAITGNLDSGALHVAGAPMESGSIGIQESWSTNLPIPVANGTSQTTTVTDNSLIYVIGGGIGGGPDVRLNLLNIYNPSIDAWSQGSPIPLPDGISAFGAAVQMTDPNTGDPTIYVFGGLHGPGEAPGVLNTLWKYDIPNNNWSAGANLPAPRWGSAVAATVNASGTPIIIIAGGENDAFQIVDTTWAYDPAADAYTTGLASMPNGGDYRIHGAADQNGLVHALSGGISLAAHYVYDPVANSWSIGPAIPQPVLDPGAVTAPSGLIYVTGSQSGGAYTQIFDPNAGTWSSGPNLPTGPLNSTSSAVIDNGNGTGTIYNEGGYNNLTGMSIPYNYSLPV